MKKLITLSLSLIMLAASSIAVAAPAMPKKMTHRQPDGSTIEVYLRGDEHAHYFQTANGTRVERNAEGYFVKALEPIKRQNRTIHTLNNAKKAPGAITTTFPTKGNVRGLVIMVEFQDVTFSEEATKEVYNQMVNQENYNGTLATGSIYDFFHDQSNGEFSLNCDVVGPVKLSQNMAYYGENDRFDVDPICEMVDEACRLVNDEVDFSQYDSNDDGMVDFIYVIYAGYGEAQGGAPETIWPQSWSLEYYSFEAFDGVYLGQFACSCELRGAEGTTLDGIGTFCHEFGHILGLPDLYDTGFMGQNPGMGYWDTMDVGSYNNESKTPAGYTSINKYALGWMTPTVLDNNTTEVTLDAFATSNKSYFLVSETDANEYYIFENRQPIEWDLHLPDHGLLVTHVKYDKKIWDQNIPNTSGRVSHEHVHLVAADNDPFVNAGDTYPGKDGKYATLTATTTPAFKWFDGTKVSATITDIREEGNQIMFRHNSTTAVDNATMDNATAVATDGGIIINNPDCLPIVISTVTGVVVYNGTTANGTIALAPSIYIVKIGDKVTKLSI